MITFRLAVVAACLFALAGLTACGGSAGPATAFPSLGADTVLFRVKGSQFLTESVHVPAGKAWTLALDNLDGVPHNVVILDKDDMSAFSSTVISGPTLRSEPAPALAAGEYRFTCSIHRDMHGMLTVP